MKKHMAAIRNSLCAVALVSLLGGCASEDEPPAASVAAESESASETAATAEAAGASEKQLPGANVKDGTRIDFSECTLRRQNSPEILPMAQATPENEPVLLGGFLADSTDQRRIFQFAVGQIPEDRDGTFTLWSAPDGKDRVYMTFEFKDISNRVAVKYGSDDPAKNDEIQKIDKANNEIVPFLGKSIAVYLTPEFGKYFADKSVMEISNKTVVTQCKAAKSST